MKSLNLKASATPAIAARIIAPLLLLTLAVMLFAAFRQGIWMDEIWSLWMSETGLSISRMAQERWFTDIHPPLFHFTNWLVAPLVGQDIFVRRLLNLFPLAYLLSVLGFIWTRRPEYRAFVLIFGTIVLTSRAALWYFPEHRSYFSVLCLAASLAALLYVVFRTRDDLQIRLQPRLAAAIFVTIILALNMHYISAVLLGAVLASSTLVLAYQRRWRWAGLIVGATFLAMIPLALGLYAQAPFIAKAAPGFWIRTTPIQAVKMMIGTSFHTLADNLVAGLAAMSAAIVAFLDWRAGRHTDSPNGRIVRPGATNWWFVFALVIGLAFGSFALAAMSVIKPIIIPRYLIAMTPLIAAVVAAIGADQILSRRYFVVLFCLNAVVLLGIYATKPLTSPRWAATIDYVRAHVVACPSTTVYALDPTFVPSNRPPNEAGIQDWSYLMLGRRNGFKVTVLHPDRAQTPVLSTRCPTLLWGEHMNWLKPVGYLMKSPMALQPGMHERLTKAKLFEGPSGFVIEIAP
ncbi:MAG: hypothetical protein JWM33_341 [Caulobacteraceae bacterium]|nr:hypothetical protein [Caulobacteraceae bacterium]